MRVMSTFSGVEGLGMRFPKDWEFIGFSEIDKYASMVLKYHYPNVKNYGDISKIDWKQVPDFDVLTGGSPCQDFSIAGKRRGLAGARSSLAWEYIRCLRDKQPKYFIWENVKGVMSSRGGWDFANLLCAFSESGYSLWWQILNAKDFGVPQNRERLFVVGTRNGSSQEVFFEQKDDSVPGDTERQVSPAITARYYKQGQSDPYIVRIAEATTVGYAEAREGDSINLSNPNSKTIRRFTPKECERLMGWHDDWTRWGIDDKGNTVEISDSQRYKMCGNGVVSYVSAMVSQYHIIPTAVSLPHQKYGRMNGI